jgi:hypothetical protein
LGRWTWRHFVRFTHPFHFRLAVVDERQLADARAGARNVLLIQSISAEQPWRIWPLICCFDPSGNLPRPSIDPNESPSRQDLHKYCMDGHIRWWLLSRWLPGGLEIRIRC